MKEILTGVAALTLSALMSFKDPRCIDTRYGGSLRTPTI